MHFNVQSEVSRNPPQSTVRVTVTARSGINQKPFSNLQAFLPLGFAPLGIEASNSTRMIIGLDMEEGVGGLSADEAGMSFRFRVTTPPETNVDRRWIVVAKDRSIDPDTGLEKEVYTGWGVATGFGVAPAPVKLNFASIPEFQGWMAISFYIPTIAGGRYALITAPLDFGVKCPENYARSALICETFFADSTMPSYLTSLKRTVNVTLVGGAAEGDNTLFALMLGVVTPGAGVIPGRLSWQVRVLDSVFVVVDSALGVAPPKFELHVDASNPTLAWGTPPQRGEVSVATVEVNFKRRVKDMAAVLISLPEKYRHDIQHKSWA
ncbi:unnamed protein product [Polarella glacialis]|uniref:Uncharacterized protein n=1 Tax=Polarella glacialis TaxID=89957 RepID=A0A813F1Q2_POLGL|nr:unnamed protein product [Polarella glacialis]